MNAGSTAEFPEASMDVDPVTDSDEVAIHCYESLIGSEFERMHGWHVNLMPRTVLRNCRPDGNPRDTQAIQPVATGRAFACGFARAEIETQ